MKQQKNYRLAVGGSRQRILNSCSYSPNEIFCFGRDESIASYHPAFLIRKNFALNSKIDKIIQNAFESGLFVKWDWDNQRKKERLIQFEPPDELTIQHFLGSFVFLVSGGAVLATITLLSERLSFRKIQNPNCSRVWIYLEHIFDGQRHCLKNLPEKLMNKRK